MMEVMKGGDSLEQSAGKRPESSVSRVEDSFSEERQAGEEGQGAVVSMVAGGRASPPERLLSLEKCAVFSKDSATRKAFAARLIERKAASGEIDKVAYFTPKKQATSVSFVPPVPMRVFCYEDIQKSNDAHNMVDNRTLLIMENSARYRNINTYVFSRLSRLSLKARHKALVDIVPFTTDPQYLYLPFCYLGREILGHQHWYAFRENYFEFDPDGKLVEGLDLETLARKIAPYSWIDYSSFFDRFEEIPHAVTEEETAVYQSLRDELFGMGLSGQSIVTGLADFAHMLESRYERLRSVLVPEAKTLLYTNIKTHNAVLKRIAGENATVRTFYDATGDEAEFDVTILFESPIVRGYLFLDALSQMQEVATVKYFSPATTVERHLVRRLKDEVRHINAFAAILRREVGRYGA